MRVTRHPPDKHIQFDYTLHQKRLEQVQSAKYLGITISDDLDWGQHISEISSKATKTLGFLRSNLAFAPSTLRKLHTKHWFVLSSSMQHLFGIPIMKLRLDRWRRYRGQLPGGPAGDGETPVASETCLTNLSGDPWRPAGKQSSLTFFYKIHSGRVSLDKDKFLTPASNLRRVRASHESQYTRYLAYSDALKKKIPRTIPMWNSLPSSVVSSKTIEEFKAQI